MERLAAKPDLIREGLRLREKFDRCRREDASETLPSSTDVGGYYSQETMYEFPTSLKATAFSTFPPRSITFLPAAGTSRYAISFFER